MAGKQGIRLGRAFVELFADDSKLVRTLNLVSRRVKRWGAEVTGIGAGILAAGMASLTQGFAAAKVFAEMGDVLAKASDRTGIAVERLSELGYAAEQSGADLGTLENGIRRMQAAITDASNGAGSALKALDLLGLSVDELAGLTPDEQFMRIAQAISEIEDPTERASAAMDIFGRSGTNLLPMMIGGRQAIDDLVERARQLGLVIGRDDAQAAVVLGDTMADLWKTMKAVVFAIGAFVGPYLTKFVETAAQAVGRVVDWVNKNRSLVLTIFAVSAAVVAVGGGIMVLGAVIYGAGIAFGVFASIIAGVGTVLAGIGSMLMAMLSPIGIVVAAIVGLGGYFLYTSGVAEDALNWIGEQFRILKDTATTAWKGIANALAAGDIGLAAKILWLTLKMEWQRGVNWLTEKWVGFKETFIAVYTEAVYGLSKLLTKAWAGIQTAWVETTSFMRSTWTKFTTGIVTGWRSTQSRLSKMFVKLMAQFDQSIDVEGATKILDEDFAREQRERDEEARKELQQIEADRAARRAQIEEEEAGALDALEQERQRRHVERNKANQAQLAAAQAKLDEARKQWQESINKAAEEAASAGESESRVKGMKAARPLPEMDLAAVERRAYGVVGTFNPMAVGGFGSMNVMERTARASEETAKNTAAMERKLRGMADNFGVFE